MKKLVLSIWAISLSLAMNSQTLEDVIAKNIAARGGLEKLKNLKTMVVESVANAQGVDMPIKVTIAHKKGFRMDMAMMGMDNYMVCNTKEGYNFFPIGGQKAPEAMPADMVKSMESQFDLQGEFIDYKEKGISLTYQGEEDVDGTMCHKILCILPSKSEKRIYIDKESNQVIKEVQKVNVNGKDTEQSSEFSNFQVVDGYTLAMEMSSPMGPMKVKKYIINSEIKDSLFEVKK